MKTAYFDYPLPEHLIAHSPVTPRDHSRLLVVNRQTRQFSDHFFYELPQFLEAPDQLVVNTTKVIPARLNLHRESGGKIEVLLISESSEDPQVWTAMIRSAKKLRFGESLGAGHRQLITHLGPASEPGLFHVKFNPDITPKMALAEFGEMPLPPYITPENQAALSDAKTRYQSVFAADEGAIAAPTASLHFTPELLAKIEAKTQPKIPVTLHVGIGTFQPIKTDTISEHVMHRETYSITPENADKLNKAIAAKSVVAVGTTVVRTLESAFQNSKINPGTSDTTIFIYPGIPIQTVSKLITNFHLPKSTLLMLVSAFADRDLIQAAYAHAIQKEYRFFSYGDAMLII